MSEPGWKEPILRSSMDRLCLFPLKHADTFGWYTKQVESFWTVNEVDLGGDRADFDSLTAGERSFIMTILSFFASSDAIVNENLADNFHGEVQVPEMRLVYGFQIGMETVHTHMYNLLIEHYEQVPAERERLFHAVKHSSTIADKAEWALNWLNADRSFAERLVAFACVEGIFFSASFCAIFHFKKRGLLKGLTFSNELISRDEGCHRDFACHVYGKLERPLSEERVHEIVCDAVNVERRFIRDALNVDIIGLTAPTMCQYMEFVADHLICSLGYQPYFGVDNPYSWMTLISMEGKSNFFERRVGEYHLTSSVRAEYQEDDDF